MPFRDGLTMKISECYNGAAFGGICRKPEWFPEQKPVSARCSEAFDRREAVLGSTLGDGEKLLVCANGAYGERMAEIARRMGKRVSVYREKYDRIPDAQRVARILEEDPEITHVGMIHSETTSGILNDIAAVGKVVKAAGKTFIVDAMSSFAGVDIDVPETGIDFLISSANKCV